MSWWAIKVDGVVVGVDDDADPPRRPGRELQEFATFAAREQDTGVQAWRLQSWAERELVAVGELRSPQAYMAKEAEARAWLAIHPTDDGAMPVGGTYLADEVAVCSCTAWEAATDIVAAADHVRLEERARRERTIAARAQASP